jgi:hypothetical protein
VSDTPDSGRPALRLLGARVPDRWSGVSTAPGWDDAVLELDRELSAIDPEYRLLQCKSKFGGLRFYIEESADLTAEGRRLMYDLIRAAEQQVATICEAWGASGTYTVVGGWAGVRCPEHDAEAREQVRRADAL